MGSTTRGSDTAFPSAFVASTQISVLTKNWESSMVQELLTSFGIQSGKICSGLNNRERKNKIQSSKFGLL